MGRTTILTLVASTLILASLACGTSAPTATPNVNATVDAAIQATKMAELAINATIEAAVDATAAAATPVPTTEYVEMTEEELAALIDQAVAEATAASQQYSNATTEATADDVVTQEEVVYVYEYYYNVDEAIAYAEELIEAYSYYYGDLATETVALLYEVEEDLEALATSTAAINSTLQEINTTLEQGLTVSEETIIQLATAAQTALTNAVEAQTQVEGVVEKLQTEIEDRAAIALATQPTNIPPDLASSILEGFQYLDTVHGGLGDNKITQEELKKIAELGANTAAGFTQSGGPELSHLAEAIQGPNGITANLARGRNYQAKADLGNLEMSLGERPSPGGVGPGEGSPGGISPGGISPGGISPGGDRPGGGGPGRP